MSATRLLGVGALPTWKFQPPRLAAPLLARPRLIAQLDQWLGRGPQAASVVLVTAPAGYGKSTLLAQWADRAEVGHAWYHADVSDDDPAVFLAGLIQTLRKRLPRGNWTAGPLLRRAGDGALAPTDARRVATVLAADIAANVKRPLALIVSGVTKTTAGGAEGGVLSALVNRAPDGLRLVLETREPPPLRLAHLLTQQRVQGLDPDDLLLRDDELSALLQLLDVPADASYLELLRTLCGGWITGVLLASGAILPAFLTAGTAGKIDAERVFDYLTSEVIEQLPPKLADFATAAAVMGYMTAPLCANLLELADASEYLADLDRQTGFLTRIGRRPQEPVYRFQPLLRRALLARLSSGAEGAERRRELHERAGLLFEEVGDSEEAIQQYLAAGRFDRAVAVIDAQRDLLLREGRGITLARWIGLLPVEQWARHPHLHVLLAELQRQSGQLNTAWATVQQACALILPQAEAHPVAAARALHTRSLIRYARGHYAAARDDCEAALRLAPADEDELRVRLKLSLAPCVAALEGPARALELLDATEPECARLSDAWLLARLHYQRSHQLITQGDYQRAEPAAAAALRFAQEANAEIDAINSLLNLGAIDLQRGRERAAREHFAVARAQSEACGYRLGTAYAVLNLGNLELDQGTYTQGRATYEQARQMAHEIGDAHLLAVVTSGLGYTLTAEGRAGEASELLRETLAALDANARDDDVAEMAIALGFARLRAGDMADAARVLRDACARAAASESAEKAAVARLHLAAAQVDLGDERAASGTLCAALDALGPGADVRPLRIGSRQLRELWPLIQRLSHPLAMALWREVEAPATAPSLGAAELADAENAIAELRVFALGEARVLVGERHVTRWRMPQARELLYFLLDRGQPVRKEVILDAFWPLKDLDGADNAFRQARFRLKQALGRDCLLQEGGRWRIESECSYDVREFERLADEGTRLAASGELAAAATALRRAITLYVGDFLDDCYSDWAVLRRDDLRRRYLAALELLGEIETRLGHADEAVQHYHRLLECEPTHESAHRALMRHYQRQGETAHAIRQFARCYNAVKHEMGLVPSKETVALYNTIRTQLTPPISLPHIEYASRGEVLV
jgi:LuxR family maltose regulon positive regulatory protein